MVRSYTLSQLCACVEEVLEAELSESYWVKAEIASLSERSGNVYFDLIEKGSKGILAAKVRATCWRNIYPMLSAYFQEQTGQGLQVGMQVLVEVEVSFHPVYGLGFNILNIDPTYTTGELLLQKQKTIQQLQQDGVWDMQQRLPLPTLIKRLAIISSPTAAGYEDFMHQIASSPFAFSLQLFPTIMQGDSAAKSLMDSLIKVAESADRYDALVIIRGGGATTDMSCFDDYNLCFCCAQFPLPIISGIGHTRDISVLDMLARLPLKTPTAVAAFLVERMQQQWDRINMLKQKLKDTADKQILVRQHRIEMLNQRLEMCSPKRIFQMGYSLSVVDGQVLKSVSQITKGQRITTYLEDGSLTSVAD